MQTNQSGIGIKAEKYLGLQPYDIDSIFSSYSTSFQKSKTTLHKKHYNAHDHFEKSIYVDFQDIKWLFEVFEVL